VACSDAVVRGARCEVWLVREDEKAKGERVNNRRERLSGTKGMMSKTVDW